ncbi:hypothetical protein AVW09_09185 [Microbacterium sp. T32]|nr:hypothetical protein AVW09_09185 [Microbacterium sp. T32]
MPTDDRVALAGGPKREVFGMSDSDVHPRPETARCGFAWCTTLHGSTVHPDDEAHRSAGIAFAARVRGVDEKGRGRDVDVEVGVLRRPDDADDWIVIEVAGGGLALSLSGAAELRRILTEDPGIGRALSS